MIPQTQKLALGSAQFGYDYGISNTRGQVPPGEVKTILDVAAAAGVDTLDTAAAYGRSEEVLGEALGSAHEFRIVSKYPGIDEGRAPRTILNHSLQRLRQKKVYGYLLHNYQSFSQRLHLLVALEDLREEGLIERIGLSFYHPDELRAVLDSALPLQLVQIPFSVFDQRFLPLLPELRRRNIEVHVRTVFLQGLVFRSPGELLPFFDPIKSRLEALRSIARESGLSVATLCLGFALLQAEVDRVVVGVTSASDLRDNLAVADLLPQVEKYSAALRELISDAEDVINPAMWVLS